MSSLYTIDQMKLVSDWFEQDDYTAEQVNMLGRAGRLRAMKEVLEGRATITMLEVEAPEPKIIVPVYLKEVTSDGLSGKDGVEDLEKLGYHVGNWAKDVMGRKAYVVSNGKVYKPVVLKGEDFTDDERVTSNIRKTAEEIKLATPPVELARLLRKSVSDAEIKAMGLTWLIVMHEAITVSDGAPTLLGLDRRDEGRCLRAGDGRPVRKWPRRGGFVFLAPQE